jgi:uncharacterized membrane protein
MDESSENTNTKTLMNLYALFGVSCVLTVLPFVSAALLSLVFLLAVLVWAYGLRKRSAEGTVERTHAAFIIQTIWVSGAVAVATTVASAIYMTARIDHAPFESCALALTNKGTEWIETAGYAEVYAVIQPCIDGFVAANMPTLILAVLIAGGPPLAYMAYRFFKGISRALKSVPAPAGWL